MSLRACGKGRTCTGGRQAGQPSGPGALRLTSGHDRQPAERVRRGGDRACRPGPREAGYGRRGAAGCGACRRADRPRCRRRPRRPGGSRRAGRHRPRRGGPGDRPRRAHRRAPRHRRPAGRGGLRARAGDVGLHPDGSGRGRPGHREDGDLAAVRRRQRLRRGPLLGDAARAPDGQRDAPGQSGHRAQRQPGLELRHLPRSAQRRHLRGQSDRRAARRRDHERGAREHRLESGLGRGGGDVRAGLRGRGGHPLQVAALPARPRADVGLPGAPPQPLEERDLLPRAHPRRVGRARPLPLVAVGDRGRA